MKLREQILQLSYIMGGLPGDVSEEPVTGEMKEGLDNEL